MKPLLENIYAKCPPPHDPRERSWVGRIDQWEVRIFSPHDTQHSNLTQKGFVHLQLWHPRWKVSVLTPSRLTGNFYELYPFRGAKLPVCCISTMNNILQQHLEVPGIDSYVLGLMERYFLFAASLQTIAATSTNKTHSPAEHKY